jgi:hypothetical protein
MPDGSDNEVLPFQSTLAQERELKQARRTPPKDLELPRAFDD